MPRSIGLRAATIAVVAATFLLLGATAERPFEPLRSVPAGAVAVITAGDPSALLANALGFLANAGLDEQAASITSMMDSLQGKDADQDVKAILSAIDLKRRFVAAVFADPESGSKTGVSVLVYLPLRASLSAAAKASMADAIASSFSSSAPSVAMDYPGYIVMGIDMEAPAFDTSAGNADGRLDLSRLADYPDSSVALWGDPKAGLRYFESMPGGLDSIFSGGSDYGDDDAESDAEWWSEDGLSGGSLNNESITDDDSGDDYGSSGADNSGIVDNNSVDNGGVGDESGEYAEDFAWDEQADPSGAPDSANSGMRMLGGMAEAVKAGLEDLESLELALIVQPERAWLKVGTGFVKGSGLYASSMAAATGDKSLPYLSYCEADALMSFAWSVPQAWLKPLVDSIYRLVFDDQSLADKTIAAMDAYAAAVGMNGGASIGVEVSDELARAVRSEHPSDDEAIALISKGLTLSASGAIELKDRQAFRDSTAAMIEFVNDPGYRAIMADSGMSFGISRKVGTVDGAPYDAYRYDIAQAGEEVEAGAAAAMAIVGSKLSPVYAYKGDKAYLGLGSPDSMKRALARDGALRPLKSDQAFKALRAGAPADARAIMFVSSKAVVRLVMRFMPSDQVALAFNASKLSGLLAWFSASPGTVGFGFGLGAEDIKAFKAIAK